jgi:hypothetical protein
MGHVKEVYRITWMPLPLRQGFLTAAAGWPADTF